MPNKTIYKPRVLQRRGEREDEAKQARILRGRPDVQACTGTLPMFHISEVGGIALQNEAKTSESQIWPAFCRFVTLPYNPEAIFCSTLKPKSFGEIVH